MTPRGLARRIARLPESAPVYESFELAWRRKKDGVKEDPRSVWYSSQKEHWLGWLGAYETSGAYGRKVTSGRSAEFAYNHIVNPQMLLWLADAAGIPQPVVLLASRAALAERTMMAMSGAIREIIPYAMVEAFLIRATEQ